MTEKILEVTLAGLFPGAINTFIDNFGNISASLINQLSSVSGISVNQIYMRESNTLIIEFDDYTESTGLQIALLPIAVIIAIIAGIIAFTFVIVRGWVLKNKNTGYIEIKERECEALRQMIMEGGASQDVINLYENCFFIPDPESPFGFDIEQIIAYGLLAVGGILAIQLIQSFNR